MRKLCRFFLLLKALCLCNFIVTGVAFLGHFVDFFAHFSTRFE